MTDWSRLDGEPCAPLVGPFPRAPFLETWQLHRGSSEVEIVVAGDTAFALAVTDSEACPAGEEHLTDYHAPLGSDPAALTPGLLALDVPLVLDSLPAEAADLLEKGFVDAGVAVRRVAGEPCVVLDLEVPGDDGWEAMLSSKQRHEVRRKRRRFEEAHGEPVLRHDPGAFGAFVDMHRSADGDKGEFMTDAMAGFFEGLLAIEGARLDVLTGGRGHPAAIAFGFDDDDAYYLYNSAFDPAVAESSPGIVLVDALIQIAAASGLHRFDFLKGTETYKRRLGGVERPLFTLEVAP